MGAGCCGPRQNGCHDATPPDISTRSVSSRMSSKSLAGNEARSANITGSSWLVLCCCKRRRSATPCDAQLSSACEDAQLQEDIATEIRARHADGSANWVRPVDAKRLLVATEGDTELCKQKLNSAVCWRRDTLEPWLRAEYPLPFEQRVVGFSKSGNPVLYGCAVHQQSFEVPPVHLACVFEQVLSHGRDLQQMEVIMDAHGFQLLYNMKMTPWLRLAPAFDAYFAERFHSLYILDLPMSAVYLWNIFAPVLPPKTREKFHFVSSKRPNDMESFYDNLCESQEMREMLEVVVTMNRRSTNKTGRGASHDISAAFVKKQRARLQLDKSLAGG